MFPSLVVFGTVQAKFWGTAQLKPSIKSCTPADFLSQRQFCQCCSCLTLICCGLPCDRKRVESVSKNVPLPRRCNFVLIFFILDHFWTSLLVLSMQLCFYFLHHCEFVLTEKKDASYQTLPTFEDIYGLHLFSFALQFKLRALVFLFPLICSVFLLFSQFRRMLE